MREHRIEIINSSVGKRRSTLIQLKQNRYKLDQKFTLIKLN